MAVGVKRQTVKLRDYSPHTGSFGLIDRGSDENKSWWKLFLSLGRINDIVVLLNWFW